MWRSCIRRGRPSCRTGDMAERKTKKSPSRMFRCERGTTIILSSRAFVGFFCTLTYNETLTEKRYKHAACRVACCHDKQSAE